VGAAASNAPSSAGSRNGRNLSVAIVMTFISLWPGGY
jgi:hypothetical protein